MSLSVSGSVAGAGGAMISYQIDGPQDAPWLILSNSLATDRRLWEPQMAGLTASRRVLRYDTRGHGKSDPGQAPYSFDELTDDVLALCAAIGIQRADFMGISLGGMTGLALALREPKLIGRLVCCDARADAPAPYQAIWDANIAKLDEVGIGGLIDPTMQRWFTGPFLVDAENAELLDLVRQMIASTSPVGYKGAAQCLQSLDLLKDLGQIECPTLYATGENDMAATVAVMEDMTSRTPNSVFKIVPDAAHLSNLEQPKTFLAIAQEFLK
ncbi:MAG: alpha/beta fold hydrolase [Roseibium sp.]